MSAAITAVLVSAAHGTRMSMEAKKEKKEELKDTQAIAKKKEIDEKRKALMAERGAAAGGYGSTLGSATQALGG